MADDTLKPYSGLLARLEASLADPGLLRLALTHTSHANEQTGTDNPHNERLEFLGDAVLELSISSLLWDRHPKAREGELSRMRASLVCDSGLADRARETGLGEFLLLGRGEEMAGGRDRDSILAAAMEAVFGAVFLDRGYEAAVDLVSEVFENRIPGAPNEMSSQDFKTRLQETVQPEHKAGPRYRQLDEKGPDHDKTFRVEVILPDGATATGAGKSKKAAEQEAARRILEKLGQDDSPQE